MNYLRFGEETFLFSSAKREDLMGRRIRANASFPRSWQFPTSLQS